jgi:hypothetical protein
MFNEVLAAIVFRKFGYFLSINDEARKNDPPSPSYGAAGEIRMRNTPDRGNSGTFLDCGGKRSATPLFFARLRGTSRINWQ